MFNEHSLYREILDNLQDGIYFVDRDRTIVFWNKGAESISGYSRLRVLGKYCYQNLLSHIDEYGNSLCNSDCPLSLTMEDGKPREARIFLLRSDGMRIPVWVRVSPLTTESGEITGAVEVFSDRSSLAGAFDRVENLERMAAIDPQMGIANQRYTEVHLRARLEESLSYGFSLGLLFIHIDHFRRLSETYGQDIATRVLKTVGGTLVHNLRPFDFIGRTVGQDILALVHNVETEGLTERAESLRVLVERSLLMVGKPIRVTISVGGTLLESKDTFESWLNRAQSLCERSRANGHNSITIGSATKEQ